jgi:hypothetical protein
MAGEKLVGFFCIELALSQTKIADTTASANYRTCEDAPWLKAKPPIHIHFLPEIG